MRRKPMLQEVCSYPLRVPTVQVRPRLFLFSLSQKIVAELSLSAEFKEEDKDIRFVHNLEEVPVLWFRVNQLGLTIAQSDCCRDGIHRLVPSFPHRLLCVESLLGFGFKKAVYSLLGFHNSRCRNFSKSLHGNLRQSHQQSV